MKCGEVQGATPWSGRGEDASRLQFVLNTYDRGACPCAPTSQNVTFNVAQHLRYQQRILLRLAMQRNCRDSSAPQKRGPQNDARRVALHLSSQEPLFEQDPQRDRRHRNACPQSSRMRLQP